MTPRKVARFAGLFATWAVASFVLAALLSITLPLAFGDRSYVVRSGSMTPAIDTGDMVVIEPISPSEARVGDIITHEDEEGRLISHRARAIDQVGEKYAFITQGDANTTQEHWQVPAEGQIGLVTYRVPKLGFAVVLLQTPTGRIGLLIVPAVLLALALLVRIWRGAPVAPLPIDSGTSGVAGGER